MIRSGWDWWWRSGVDETDGDASCSNLWPIFDTIGKKAFGADRTNCGLWQQTLDASFSVGLHDLRSLRSFNVWRWYIQIWGDSKQRHFQSENIENANISICGLRLVAVLSVFVCALLFALNLSSLWCSHNERSSLYLCKYKEQKQVDMWCCVHFCHRWWPCSSCSLGQSGSLHDCVVMTETSEFWQTKLWIDWN